MKKFLIVLFILVQGLIFATGKNLADIKTLKFDVVEIKKEVTAPKLNKGEIYLYDYSVNQKSVYLPMFNEVRESQIVDDENRIIKAINKIIEEEKKNKNFKQKYDAKIAQTLDIDKQISINILTYLEVEGYIFPETVEIKDSGTKIADVKISNLQINPKLEEKILLNAKK